MTWAQVYMTKRDAGCVCVDVWAADLRLTWCVCVCVCATLDLAAIYAFIQVSLSVDKKQLICSLIHTYQEVIWERERC